jgi:hypothetical protein
MRRKIGRFIFDWVVKYIQYLDDVHFDELSERVYRPAFTRKRTLPELSGKTIRFFDYKPLGDKNVNV